MLSSIQANDLLSPVGPLKHLSIRDYFQTYKSTLKLIHLSNSRNLGIGKDHGCVFDANKPEEIETLKLILKCIKEISFDGNITLEVYEDKHDDAQSYLSMVKILKEVE